jgi:hypothetical protein
MQSRYEGNGVTVSDRVGLGIFQLPVDLVHKDKDTGSNLISLHEHVVTLTYQRAANPLNQIAKYDDIFRNVHLDALLVVKQVLKTPTSSLAIAQWTQTEDSRMFHDVRKIGDSLENARVRQQRVSRRLRARLGLRMKTYLSRDGV